MNGTPTPVLENPLYADLLSHRQDRVSKVFPDLGAAHTSLLRYHDESPERFYTREVEQAARLRLDQIRSAHAHDLDAYFERHQQRIDHALRFIAEANRHGWHEELEAENDHLQALLIDRDLHPTYLRLIEGALTPLTHLFAHFSRVERGKGTDGLDIYSIHQELQGGPMEVAVQSYNNTVRNGVAHGGVVFEDHDFRYTDKKGNVETLRPREIVRLLDDLVDDCNGLALAYRRHTLGAGKPILRQHVFEELQAITNTPWWTVEGCIPSVALGDREQLNLFVRVSTSDAEKVRFSAIQTAIVAESLMPGMDRYFLSFHGRKGLPGFSAFKGPELRTSRMNPDSKLEELSDAVEQAPFFSPYRKLPRIFHRAETMTLAANAAWLSYQERALNQQDSCRLVVRETKGHRNAWGLVVNAQVVFRAVGEPEPHALTAAVRDNPGAIIRAAVMEARRARLSSWERALPVAFAQVAVFKRDYRRRRLRDFGLGEDLVCTVRFQRMSRIRSPDISGSAVEMIGPHRVAWNRAWMQETGWSPPK